MSYDSYEANEADNKNTFEFAVVTSVGFGCEVKYLQVSTTTNRRRLNAFKFLRSWNDKKLKAAGDLLFTYTISIVLDNANRFNSAEEAYLSAKQSLNESVIDGDFQSYLQNGGGAFM